MTCEPCKQKDLNPPAKKEICGFRVWYYIGIEITEFKGDSFADWDAMPDSGFQDANLYENWCADDGYRYQHGLHGEDHYYCIDDPGGLIFVGDSKLTFDELKSKFPNASIKKGTQLSDALYKQIGDISGIASEF